MWSKLKLYFFTIRHLTFTQVRYRIFYFVRARVRKIIGFSYQKRTAPRSEEIHLEESLPAVPSVQYQNGTFCFLNLERSYKDGIDWNDKTHGKLWTYNLNYFEYLHIPTISKEAGEALIKDFIQKINEAKDGLEPYPISLRAIHWVKFLTYHKIRNRSIDESLYHQLWILVDKREYHILGNHLLENGFGLLFGAYYFNDAKLYKYAKDILIKELKEQVLPDGAHFELSPMYHQLMLYRVLDCYNLVKNNSFFDQELLSLFEEKAELMLGWLEQMTFENGEMPLLNDSAFGINPTTKELVGYASRLGIQEKVRPLKESGYRKIKTANYELVADLGKIGPDYIPGHAHSDIFSFELYAKGKPWLVDTGTSTYEASARRLAERATAAHNTVTIGAHEQVDIWSSFRVARRSSPQLVLDNQEKISAVLDYVTVRARHQRTFFFGDESIRIIDEIEAPEAACAHLHFCPSQTVRLTEHGLTTALGEILILGASKINIIPYEYAPEFNKRQAAQKALIHFDKSLEIRIVPI